MPPRNPRPLELHPSGPDDLPLGFEAGLHFTGRQKPFHDVESGRALAGRTLDKALSAFGVGPVTVEVTGRYRAKGGDPGKLDDWTERTQLAGSLDPRALGAVVHGLARRVAERQGKGNTAPEVYFTGLRIIPPAPPQPSLFDVPKPRPIYRERITIQGHDQAIYRDRSTGRFAKRTDWADATKARKRK